MTYEGLGEMFGGDSADTCGRKFPLMLMGGRANGPACADGERGPPSAQAVLRNKIKKLLAFFHLNIGQVQRNVRELVESHGVCRPLHSMNRLRVPLSRDSLINSGLSNMELAHSDNPLEGLKILGKYLL